MQKKKKKKEVNDADNKSAKFHQNCNWMQSLALL